MKIIVKFVINNIRDNRFRTFLIILSVMLSCGLYFASSAISDTLENMYSKRMKASFGSAEIIAYKGNNSDSPFFLESKFNSYNNYFEYILGGINATGFYKPHKNEVVRVDLRGFDLEDLNKMNPIYLLTEFKKDSFYGRKIIISSLTASKYMLDIGDTIDLEIGGRNYKFHIIGITKPEGIFQENGQQSIIGLVPKDTLASLLNAKNRVSIIYIKPKAGFDIDELIERLSKDFGRFIDRRPISLEEVRQNIQMLTTPFMMTTTIVLFMSIFIIYTSFKVITMERLPIIGTLRSVGATRKMTDLILIMESLFYGIIGGVLGCGFGLGVLYIMTYLLSEDPWAGIRLDIDINFSISQLITAFTLAIILSIVSSIIPIIKTSKIPVKDIVLNNFHQATKKNPWKLYLGVSFFIISLTVPWIVPRSIAVVLGVICMLMIGASLVLLIPYLINFIIVFFEKVYIKIFGNEGVLAVKNLKDNKNILNNIALLSIGISTLLMINTVSYSVVTEVTNYYKDANFEIWMWLQGADRKFDSRLRTVDGVTDVYGIIGSDMVEIENNQNTINLIQGVDKNKFLQFWDIDIKEEDLNKLDEGRYILLTYASKEKLGVDVGDVLTLKLPRGNRDYYVSGFFNCLRWNGSYALVGERFLKIDTSNGHYQDIYIKTSRNPKEVAESLRRKFARYRPFVDTVSTLEENNRKSNAQMFIILKGFSIMALVIGVFGVMNNLVISFIQRKRNLAMFRSIGMSKGQIVKMIFIEALTGGIIGGLMGIVAGVLMIAIIPNIMKAMDSPIPMHYSFELIIYSLLSGIAIKVIASISPALRTSKLNIVEAIKYE